VELGFAGDRGVIAREDEIVRGDGSKEVLSHFLGAEHGAYGLANGRRPAQRPAFTANPGLDSARGPTSGSSLRLRPRSAARAGLRHTIRRSPG